MLIQCELSFPSLPGGRKRGYGFLITQNDFPADDPPPPSPKKKRKQTNE